MKIWYKLLQTDLRVMLRRPDNVWAMLLFGLTILIIFHFSLPPAQGRSIRMGCSALWMSLIFSAVLGLPPLQHRPDAVNFLTQLVTSPVGSAAYFWEKLIAGFIQIVIVTTVMVPVTMVIFNFPLVLRIRWALAYLVIGLFGLTVVVTLASALTVGRERWLLPVLVFPLTLPIILSTTEVMAGTISSQMDFSRPWMHVLIAYDLLLLSGGWFLADFLWIELPDQQR